jgi:hypothetical protein
MKFIFTNVMAFLASNKRYPLFIHPQLYQFITSRSG